ncbi:MAG: sigma-54 dependent transcriptional regulator [Acidobacteriota bacterium]
MDDRSLILTVDDDPDLSAIIHLHLRRWGYAVAGAGSAAELRAFLDARRPENGRLGEPLPAAMLMDVHLGDANGSDLVAEVRRRHPGIPVIMITRDDEAKVAVRCMKGGATDYILKPLDFGHLRTVLDGVVEPPNLDYHGLIGQSPLMCQLYEVVDNAAPTDVSALILGETGTGKELVARAMHQASRRRNGPFIPVNAASIPRELIESSLFGHARGAFTGAHQATVGYCEQADGGTLFLDEIGEMDFDVQAKLLRFLQDHVVQPVGSSRTRQVDVRVLAATNVDPKQKIAERRLREDLYYRLRVICLQLPPLRQRQDDIERLALHFLQRSSARHRRSFTRIAHDALRALMRYPWPGNVRELENAIESAVVMHYGDALTADMLPAEVLGNGCSSFSATAAPVPVPILSARQQAEKEALVAACERSGWRPESAARELGISRATIYRRLKKYGLAGG